MSEILNELNDEQKHAVTYQDGPLLVLAGPGTGKTRVTCNKMAYLIKEAGYSADSILALTFSDKAAQEMQERVTELLPKATELQVSTFHSFCYQLIRDHALELGINTSGPIITGEHQQAFLLANLDNFGITSFEVPARPVDLAKTMQGAIQRFKQENITVDDLLTYLAKKEVEGPLNEELAKLKDLTAAYQAYEEFKKERGLLDFGDMQYYALKLFDTHPEILTYYQDQYRYLIVDEFQDNDFIQLELLFRLCPSGNITIVGDDDQSIYRFRGAYLTNIQGFRDHYSNLGIETKTIVLETNYRCTENIQTVAQNLIRNNPNRGEKVITTDKGPGDPVRITKYENDWEQAKEITRSILSLHEDGQPWEDIAVLVRKRALADYIIENFLKAGVPYEIIGSRGYFQHEVVKAAGAYLKVLEDPVKYQPSLAKVLRRPVHGILPGEIPKLGRYARSKDVSWWEALQDLDDFPGDARHFRRAKKELDRFFTIKGDEGLLSLVRAVLFGKDLFRVEIARKETDNIRYLNRFLMLVTDFLEIYPDAQLEDLLVHLEALQDLGIEDETTEPQAGVVHLLTVHGAKGKEFPVVFIPSVNKSKFPSTFRKYTFEIPTELLQGVQPDEDVKELHEQEERRLFYVGITRGKEEVYLSYCRKFGQNKKDTARSKFLEEILSTDEGYEEVEITEIREEFERIDSSARGALYHQLITQIEREDWQEAATALAGMVAFHDGELPSVKLPKTIDLDQYFTELKVIQKEPEVEHLKDVVYSPSRLKTYDDCPQKYYFNYVLKIPGLRKSFFSLGTAVHGVCEHVAKDLMQGKAVDEERALDYLDAEWNAEEYESVTKEQQDKALAQEMVRSFLARQAGKESEIIGIEKWIQLEMNGRLFRGKVDRIDQTADGLIVYDYKTSKNRTSRPELRKDFQMALYSLGIAELFEKPVQSVGHWYLRMDQEWMVELTEDELASTVERIDEVTTGIENHQFEAKPGYRTCMYCDYQELCDAK